MKTFQGAGLGVFQIGVSFSAAMNGYAFDKIHQELASEEDFSVRDNFPRSWAEGVSDWAVILSCHGWLGT